MTATQVIAEVKKLRPHAFTDEEVANWIWRVDGELSDLFELDGAPLTYSWNTDNDKMLYVPYPYDDLYVFYCIAMIDYFNRDYDQYINSYSMYNARMDGFKKYYYRTHSLSSSGSNGYITVN